MRSFYIFLNLFLFIVAMFLLVLNFSYRPQPPDKILSMAPVLNESVQPVRGLKGGREAVPDVAALWENNLFSPYRSGEGGALLGAAKPTGMELMGVCSFGDVSGAIILDKQTSVAAPSQFGRLRGRVNPLQARGSSSATAPHFYKLGEQLENNFTLSEINSDSVVLSRGREQIVLKLEYEGEDAISRNTAAAEAVAAATSAAIKTEGKAKPDIKAGAPNVPVPGARTVPVPAVPGATGARGAAENPSTPAASEAPEAQSVLPRVRPPLSRRTRQPSAPAQ
jgi:hypothetical protein